MYYLTNNYLRIEQFSKKQIIIYINNIYLHKKMIILSKKQIIILETNIYS